MDSRMDHKTNYNSEELASGFLYDWPLPDDEEVENTTSHSNRALIVIVILMAAFPLASALRVLDSSYGVLLLCGSIFVCGLITYTDKAKKYPDQRYFSLLTMATSLSLVVIPVILMFLDASNKVRMTILGLISIAFGVMTLVLPVLADKRRKARCYYHVTATVVNIHERADRNSRTMLYAPLWQYEIYGEVYRKMGLPLTTRFMKHEGDQTEFYVNPDSPHEIYQPLSVSVLFFVFTMLLFASVGVALIGHNYGLF